MKLFREILVKTKKHGNVTVVSLEASTENAKSQQKINVFKKIIKLY